MGSIGQHRLAISPLTPSLLLFFLGLSVSQNLNPPRLDDDTDINDFGSDQQDPDTELVAEQPVGSGHVVVISDEPEFTPKLPGDEIVDDKDKELYDENIRRKDVDNISTPK